MDRIDTNRIRRNAARASRLLGAMANEKRLVILCLLHDGQRSVNELALLLDSRQSTVSQHLALLRKDGFVECRRDAQTQLYSLAGDEVRSVIAALHALYSRRSRK